MYSIFDTLSARRIFIVRIAKGPVTAFQPAEASTRLGQTLPSVPLGLVSFAR
jgi:hypothetical protein